MLKRILITFLCILSTLGSIFYYLFCNTTVALSVTSVRPSRLLSPCLSSSSSPAASSKINCNQCHLSLRESDGWFCEFDEDWQRRKSLHHMQNRRNRLSNDREYFFLYNWHPTIHCQFQRRIGESDGGKWVCDIHKLKSLNSTPPLIYSFGSNGDFSFEKAIKKELPESEIHTFDRKLFVCPPNICIFHQAFLGDGENNSSKSLQMILNELGHQKRDLDILKVDIEGSEFQLFSHIFNSINISSEKKNRFLNTNMLPYIRQILVEIHLEPSEGENESPRAHNLFEAFRQNNYAIFHKEVNLDKCQSIFEYAFLRLNPKFFITSHVSSPP